MAMQQQFPDAGSWVSLARLGAATRVTAGGEIAEVTAGVLRFDHDPVSLAPLGLLIEGVTTNACSNPRAEGAAIGELGGDGDLPAQWQGPAIDAGITVEVTATGITDGIAWVEIRCHGTTTEDWSPDVYLELAPALAAAGEAWSGSLWCAVTAGAWPLPSAVLRLEELDGVAVVETHVGASFAGDLAAWGRRQVSAALTEAGTDGLWLSLSGDAAVGTGIAVDVTIRIGGPQLERAVVPTSLVLPPPAAPAPALRQADDVALRHFADVWRVDQGTLGMAFIRRAGAAVRGLWRLESEDRQNSVAAIIGADGVARIVLSAAGAEIGSLVLGAASAGDVHQVVMSYGPAGVLAALDGGTVASLAGVLPAGLVRLLLGRGGGDAGALPMDGWLRALAYRRMQITGPLSIPLLLTPRPGISNARLLLAQDGGHLLAENGLAFRLET